MSTLCEDVEREVAAWGTCAHQIAEKCLLSGPYGGQIDASEFIGIIQKSGKFEFTVDEEMANCSQVYVDYCRKRLKDYLNETGEEAEFWVEQSFTMKSLNPPLQAGGTCDCVIWFPKWKLLEPIDLKGGRGVTVDVKGNPQARSYGISAVLCLPAIKPERVKVTIVQPRVGDGLPKSEEFHVAELFDWTYDLLGHMQKSADALDAFDSIGGTASAMLFNEWCEAWLNPGQCTFCTAKPICPALRKKALAAMPELARRFHEDTTLATPPSLSNLAKIGSPEELAHDLDGFDELEGWIKARRAYAHAEAERGTAIPNYGLVDKIGNRTWIEKTKYNSSYDEIVMYELNLTEDQTYEPVKIKSVAQIEKVLGKRKAELAKFEGILWEKPIKGTNLVRLDKTTRPAAKSTAERFNEKME